jgi:hypothetical protein
MDGGAGGADEIDLPTIDADIFLACYQPSLLLGVTSLKGGFHPL